MCPWAGCSLVIGVCWCSVVSPALFGAMSSCGGISVMLRLRRLPPTAGGIASGVTEGPFGDIWVNRSSFGRITSSNDAEGTTVHVFGHVVMRPMASTRAGIEAESSIFAPERPGHRDNYVLDENAGDGSFPDGRVCCDQITVVPLYSDAGQRAFELTGNRTIHGVTRMLAFQGIATLRARLDVRTAKTNFTFAHLVDQAFDCR